MISGKQIEKYTITQQHLDLETPSSTDLYSGATVYYVNSKTGKLTTTVDGGIIYGFTGDTKYEYIRTYNTHYAWVVPGSCWSQISPFVFHRTPCPFPAYTRFLLEYYVTNQNVRFTINNDGNNDHVSLRYEDQSGSIKTIISNIGVGTTTTISYIHDTDIGMYYLYATSNDYEGTITFIDISRQAPSKGFNISTKAKIINDILNVEEIKMLSGDTQGYIKYYDSHLLVDNKEVSFVPTDGSDGDIFFKYSQDDITDIKSLSGQTVTSGWSIISDFVYYSNSTRGSYVMFTIMDKIKKDENVSMVVNNTIGGHSGPADISRFSYHTDSGQEITISAGIPTGNNTFDFTAEDDTNTFYIRISDSIFVSPGESTVTIVSIDKIVSHREGYKLSSDLKWNTDELIVNGNIKLSSGTTNSEGDIKYDNKNIWVNTGGTAGDWVSIMSSGSNGFTPPENVVIVDPTQPEIPGKIYQTWSDADTYVQGQSPSESNRWTIKITSTNNEDITVMPYVVIEGEKGNTFLNGRLMSDTMFSIDASAKYTSVVRQCYISNIDLQPGGYLSFYDCDLSGTTTSTGAFVQLFESSVIAGDYSQYSFFQLFNGLVNGGKFSDTIDARGTEFFDNFELNGGKFENCYLRNRPNSTYKSGDYTLINTIIKQGWDTNPGDIIDMYNCTILENATWGTGATFNTYSITGSLNLTDNSNWNNSGITYDNTHTSLSATNTQDAIDELYDNIQSGTSGTSGTDGSSGTSGIDGLLPEIGDNYNVLYRDSGSTYGYNSVSNLTYYPSISGITIGDSHNLSSCHSSITGGYNNTISGTYSNKSFIGGGNCNTIFSASNTYSSYSVIAGGNHNTICSTTNSSYNKYSFIGAGQCNVISANCNGNDSFIGVGYCNSISGSYSSDNFIGAGTCNKISGVTYSFIGGGENNKIYGLESDDYSSGFIGGGNYNTVYGRNSSVVGGMYNTVNGACSLITGGIHNEVSGNTSAIVSGYGNTLNGDYSFIGGGQCNYNNSNYSFIGSGSGNTTSSDSSFIGGGTYNVLSGETSAIVSGSGNTINSDYSFIGGGKYNTLVNHNNFHLGHSFIGGGYYNTLDESCHSFIGAGCNNTITNSVYSFVGSGLENCVNNMFGGVISGAHNIVNCIFGTVINGESNTVSGSYSTINNGLVNCIKSSQYSFIAGGSFNYIYLCESSSILSGNNNYIYKSNHSTIGGARNKLFCSNGSTISGLYNEIHKSQFSSISNGYRNSMYNNNSFHPYDSSFIGGGNYNTLSGITSFIGGGTHNVLSGETSAIVSGSGNTINSDYSFIGGGSGNTVSNNYSIITGGMSNTISSNSGTGYSVIGNGRGNTITNKADFTFIANGWYNKITDEYSFIGGGGYNTTNCWVSFIGNGFYNYIDDNYSFIGNGGYNTISGHTSSIVNGNRNVTTRSGDYSFIGGGYKNTASNTYTFIGNGCCSTVSGYASFVANGGNNEISSDYSFIGNGLHNKANSYMTSVFGRYNIGTGTTDSWVQTDSLFEIGNGTSDTNRSNALTVYKNGNLDVQSQIKIHSGSTYDEGEIRYKDNYLWVNTGGTASDWSMLWYNASDVIDTSSGLTVTNNKITAKVDDSTVYFNSNGEISANTNTVIVSTIDSDIVMDHTNGTGYTNEISVELQGDNSYYTLKSLIFYSVSANDDEWSVGIKVKVHRDYMDDSSIKYISPVNGSYSFYGWEQEPTVNEGTDMTFLADGIVHTGNISGTTSVQFSIFDDTVTGSTLTIYNGSYLMLTKL